MHVTDISQRAQCLRSRVSMATNIPQTAVLIRQSNSYHPNTYTSCHIQFFYLCLIEDKKLNVHESQQK